jgi:hydrogenase maturation factor
MDLPYGKISPNLLSKIVFKSLGSKRQDVVLGPKKGEDAAIVKIGSHLVAVSCDPISGAVSRIGWLAVHVVSNDVASTGTRPLWFLPCILLPKGTSSKTIEDICTQMHRAAKTLDIAIIGGHTEISPGIDHPIIIGCAMGVIDHHKYVTSSGAKPQDVIILTKSAGLEGSAILVTDRVKEISSRFGESFVKRVEGFFDKISVLNEALTALEIGGVTSMHDPTEGGIAGGLHEVSDASKTGFRVYEEMIRVEPETKKIVTLFQIDPLQLISSGSLLITCNPQSSKRIIEAFRIKGIDSSIIGEVLEDPDKRIIVRKGGFVETLHYPESDALWTALDRKI